MSLIDRGKVMNDYLENLGRADSYKAKYEALVKAIDDATAVDAEPVRHGRWLPTNDDNKKRCSECDVIHLIAQYPHGQANYCPNCGAKMDGDTT